MIIEIFGRLKKSQIFKIMDPLPFNKNSHGEIQKEGICQINKLTRSNYRQVLLVSIFILSLTAIVQTIKDANPKDTEEHSNILIINQKFHSLSNTEFDAIKSVFSCSDKSTVLALIFN